MWRERVIIWKYEYASWIHVGFKVYPSHNIILYYDEILLSCCSCFVKLRRLTTKRIAGWDATGAASNGSTSSSLIDEDALLNDAEKQFKPKCNTLEFLKLAQRRQLFFLVFLRAN